MIVLLQISVEQVYINHEAMPLEATYIFPVEEAAAVVEFEAWVDGRQIKTVVKKKETAEREYQEIKLAERST